MSTASVGMPVGLVVALAAFSAVQGQTKKGETGSGKEIKVTWLGHAAFEVVSPGGTRLLIDPFLKQNPSTPEEYKDLSRYKPAAILVSHSHSDHSADAAEIAKASGAAVVGALDYVKGLGLPDAQTKGGNVGGTFTFRDVKVNPVPAMHSSGSGGPAPGGVPTVS